MIESKSVPLSRIRELHKIIGLRLRKEKDVLAILFRPCYSNNPTQILTFERLEFFGDVLLNFAICEKLFQKFPDANEGLLSRFRSTLVSKKVLLRIAKTLKLNRLLMTNSNGHAQALENSKLLSDSLEALIGVIYLDRGLSAVRKFIWKHWRIYFDPKKLARLDPNPKSALQEISQKLFRTLPTYEVKPDRKNGFSASVWLVKRLSGKGKGMSKQAAEEGAALELIRKLKSKKNYSRLLKKATPKA